MTMYFLEYKGEYGARISSRMPNFLVALATKKMLELSGKEVALRGIPLNRAING